MKPHFQLYIDGEFREGASGTTWSTENPANGESWASFACADKSDVELAVSSARRALHASEWRDLTATQRGKLLYRLAELVEQHAVELGKLETFDSGKLLSETTTQTSYVADYYRYFAGLADKLEGAVLPIDKPDMHVYTSREPIGVVCAVVPWNAQMFLTATKLGPALAAGCTVVIKASEVAPCPMLKFAELIHEAGFPAGVVSVITGDVENCAVPLTSHPDIDRIAFTGGPESARHVLRNSANSFAVTSLELGGKSPIIVFDDADLESAVNGAIAGNFGASGQSCVAGSRVLVSSAIKDKFIQKLVEQCQGLRVDDPMSAETHLGPVCTSAQVATAERTIEKSIAQGAILHLGGERVDCPGNYFSPTVLECSSPETESLLQEMFAPVMSVMAFDSEQDAIELANNSEFGLGSGIFTRDLARAHRVSGRLRSGICWINTYRAISPIAPFGGFNQSGYGREAGVESLLDYTRTRTTWINLSDQPMANPFVMR